MSHRPEGRTRRWIRTTFASTEAKHGLDQSMREFLLVLVVGLAFSFAIIAAAVAILSGQSLVWQIAAVALATVFGGTFAVLEMASSWERARYLKDEADHKAAMAKQRFDNPMTDIDEREAYKAMRQCLIAMHKARDYHLERSEQLRHEATLNRAIITELLDSHA